MYIYEVFVLKLLIIHFINRLQEFLTKQKMKLCGENAGYGGSCITDYDVVDLWRLYLEVRPS